MASGRAFGPSESRILLRAVRTAEDLTGRFYCIPGREWPRYPYELRTRSHGPGPAAPAFADVVRLVARRPRAPASGPAEMWRIRLRDDAILSAVRERDDGIDLFPLLLYVLTHELVHVVRFGSRTARFHASLDARKVEEARVHGITERILEAHGEPSVSRVVRLYGRRSGEPGLADCVSPK